jgi:serine/threonine protein kinase
LDRAVLETASDRYVIVEYLAEGGMGAIYLGKKLGVDGFEKEVVLKQLLPEYTREPKFIDLFLREARLSASLDHANIVRTVDLVNAGEDYFMVMEYVRGGDLRTLMRRARRKHKKFTPQAAVFIGHEILEALAYAHGKAGGDGKLLGLIHRDVSPSNILLSGAGEVKLTDFGIAKAGTHRSVFFKVKGKVGYMAPEQARGEAVDKRTDVFSLGVVLYEVLAGERLFVGDLMSSAAMIYSQKVVPPSQRRPEIPAEIDAVLLKALELDPARRFQSAEEFQDALGRAASRNRLLCGASEMAAHLKDVCGPDPGTWLKLENLGPSGEESQAIAHGTAVLSSMSDEDEEDPFDESAPHRTRHPHRPITEFQKELTSVIALRGDEVDIISDDSSAVPLKPLAPARSAPHVQTPTPTPTVPFNRREAGIPSKDDFGHEDSRASTRIRSPEDSPRRGTPLTTPLPPPKRDPPSKSSRPSPSPDGERKSERTRSPAANQASTGAETIIRTGSSQVPAPSPSPRGRGEVATRALQKPPPGKPGPVDFESTDSVRRDRSGPTTPDKAEKTRIVPVVIVLILIGIAVALVVAFSGPSGPD